MVLRPRRTQAGLGLIELLIATAISAALLAALGSVARQSLQARAPLRDKAEALWQGRFALQRVSAAAQAAAPGALLPPAANTSGNWFGTVYFCVNGAAALVETVSTDTACSGTQVIADRVSAFTVAAPASAGALDGELAELRLSLSGADGGAMTLTEQVRLGGGVQ